MEEHLEEGFPGQFSDAMKMSLAQNVNTTWTASGHLVGRAKKIRSLPRPGWAASTFAMFVGYLTGLRGEILLNSIFAHLVAAPPAQLLAHLTTAASRHLLRLRHAGGVFHLGCSGRGKICIRSQFPPHDSQNTINRSSDFFVAGGPIRLDRYPSPLIEFDPAALIESDPGLDHGS
jgi:hypothetical protein